ncbi:hypothetical protein FRC06_003344 [Ceratobasidium sp. 370]|nr:hypothetical protein FRC06_003344 [Ceratobasidium sp. 370]
MPDNGGATTANSGSGSGSGSGSASGSGSGSGSGSSSSDSAQTVRQNPKHIAPAQPEHTTFTFSSRHSPFIHTSPPGSIVFTPAHRRGSDVSRDRIHRRQPGAPQTALPKGDSDWIPLRPLQPVKEISMPLFTSPKPRRIDHGPSTVVFGSRSPPEAQSSRTRPSPRLSLVAQHYHATARHPFFDAPPQLVTPPPPQDPFSQLAKRDSYFLPASYPKHTRSSEVAHKHHQPSSSKATTSSGFQQPQASSSRTPTVKGSKATSTPKYQEHIRAPSLFLSEPKPRPLPTPVDQSVFVVSQSQSQSATPRPPKSRSPKTITPPNYNRSSPQPQPSIAVFKDCFGVLTAAENLFPTFPRSRSRGGSDAGSGGRGKSDFQRRWTKRWLRRTMRGVGSMGSGSGSGSSVDAPAQRRARSSGGNSGSLFPASKGAQSSSGSQDSLDRVRVSRSNAGSPSGGPEQRIQSADLSDVDEVGTDAEGGDSPDREVEAAIEPATSKLMAAPTMNTSMEELEMEAPTVTARATT